MEETNMCLYRLLQEALTNVARHARAHRAWVVLSRDKDMITLSVEDDGKGFDYSTDTRSGIGLLGMQERIRLLGGQLELESQPQAGARLVAHLPCSVETVNGRGKI
jgi:signal transduction histidine kinase